MRSCILGIIISETPDVVGRNHSQQLDTHPLRCRCLTCRVLAKTVKKKGSTRKIVGSAKWPSAKLDHLPSPFAVIGAC